MLNEKEGYQENLKALTDYFHKHWVYPKELADYMGMDYRTAMKKFGITRDGISIEVLAGRLCR